MTTVGKADAKAILDRFPIAFDYLSAENLHIAAADAAVLTERIDHFHAANGNVVASIRICGIFEVADGRIRRWRDYFDTAPLAHRKGGPE